MGDAMDAGFDGYTTGVHDREIASRLEQAYSECLEAYHTYRAAQDGSRRAKSAQIVGVEKARQAWLETEGRLKAAGGDMHKVRAMLQRRVDATKVRRHP